MENGLIVASLRYEEKTAEQVLGVKYLPLISSSDTMSIKLLFYNAHCINAGPFTLHLNKSTTVARLRQGNFGPIIAPKFPCLRLAAVVDLFRCKVKGLALIQ